MLYYIGEKRVMIKKAIKNNNNKDKFYKIYIR